MKKVLFIVALLALVWVLPIARASAPFDGTIIALDAGHGGGESGAVGYCLGVPVAEEDVNRAVRAELKSLLDGVAASVFEVPQLASRRDRVQAAEDAHADVLISIHHNGSSNTSTDYTQSFVTQKNDKELALPIQSALAAALGLPDRGIKSDGYGMTVYGSLPGVLTEAYFITDTDEACDFLGARARVSAEARAMFDGLATYFLSRSDGGGGSCSPDAEKQGKC